jgi:DNA-binding HxlR family transcriptional regulator|tara:strand:- start:118 stop:549 length:432 start_codon:yes stop_codon:yes gene_type:complete
MVLENFRCTCPITSALDIVGDKWSLVIIKQMLLQDCRTFKDFSESKEAIAPNILSARLKTLEKLKFIEKKKIPQNKKTNIYVLTENGLSLTPIIVELALWSDHNLRPIHKKMDLHPILDAMNQNKNEVIKSLQKDYKIKTATL